MIAVTTQFQPVDQSNWTVYKRFIATAMLAIHDNPFLSLNASLTLPVID